MKTMRVVGIVLLCLALLLASTSCGESEQSSDTTAPSAPTNLTSTSPCNDSTPTFTWNPATDDDSGVDYYQTSITIDAGGVGGIWGNIGNVTTYTCNAALSEGSHTFWVSAVDKAGNSGTAASLNFTRDTTQPIISSVSASVTSASSATITWTTNEDTTCHVEYGITTAYGSSQPASINGLSSYAYSYIINLTGLTANTTYHCRVRSRDVCGNEASSNDETFTTVSGLIIDDTPPTVPTGLVLTTGLTGGSNVWVRGDWANSYDAGIGMANYIVEWWIPGLSHQQHQIQATIAPETPYVLIENAMPNTLYSMKVSSVDKQFNESDFCPEGGILSSKDTTAPTPPASVGAIGVVGGIMVSWSASASLDTAEYILYCWESNTPESAYEVCRGDYTSKTVTGQYDVDYYFWVAAVDTSGNIGAKSTAAGPVQQGWQG